MTDQSEIVIVPKKKVSKKKILVIEDDDVPLVSTINKELFAENFMKCVKGYHFINTEPINETVWEAINGQVLELSGCSVKNSSRGSHLPGKDITCGFGGLSNKSAKYSKKGSEFAISSYRLTTVCSDKDCGEVETIVQEIKSRKNYDYYSFIVRDESDESVYYDWYLIPGDYPVLSPESYTWEPMYGQRGKKTGEQVGWKTNEINGSKMSITFSMSSQLWISVAVTDELKTFIVESCSVSRKTKLNYLQVYDMFSSEEV